MLDTQSTDVDADDVGVIGEMFEDDEEVEDGRLAGDDRLRSEEVFSHKAAEIYGVYSQ